MRILHTNFLHGWGGQSNRILTVCRGLVERGHAVTIAAPDAGELVRRAREAGLATDGSMRFRRGLRPVSLLRDVLRMRRLLAGGAFDVIHTHGSQDSWIVALADLRRRVPVVRTKHNVFPIRDHFGNRWLYGRVFDRIICISQAIVEQCAQKPYIDRERLALIHSAADLDRFAAPDPAGVSAWREQWGAHRPVLAMVGRLREEKGHRVLFEAVARLRGDYPRILLAVAGDGSLREDLQTRVTALGMADCVRFLGFRTDVPELLAAADLFALPSLSEGLGTAVIEAAAAAKPTVATFTGGIPDIIRDGETGRLVEPGNVDALTRALADVLADPAAAQCMGKAAQRFVREHFTTAALVEKTEAVYVEMLRRARG